MILRIFENKTSKLHPFADCTAKTKADVIKILEKNNIMYEGHSLVVKETKATLELDSAELPDLESVTIMLIPSDHKGGALSYNELRAALRGTTYAASLGSSPTKAELEAAYERMQSSQQNITQTRTVQVEVPVAVSAQSASTVRAVAELEVYLEQSISSLSKALAIVRSGELTISNEVDAEIAQLARMSSEFSQEIIASRKA